MSVLRRTLELVTSSFHRLRDDSDIQDGIIACHCCVFPVIDDIPVMHLNEPAPAAKDQIEAGRPDLARRAMLNLEGEYVARFEAVAASSAATYREALAALGPAYESGYFLYRFSDPGYVVAQPLIRAIARTVVNGGRVVDLCGGSGHLTRSLMDLTPQPPVLADLYYAKLWLARRFTAPGCEAICCDGNSPFPFARAAFRFAICADAFMFIWTKRQFVQEMLRVIGDGRNGEAAAITHTHNQLQWSPSLGQPLPRAAISICSRRCRPSLQRGGAVRRRDARRAARPVTPRFAGINRRRSGIDDRRVARRPGVPAAPGGQRASRARRIPHQPLVRSPGIRRGGEAAADISRRRLRRRVRRVPPVPARCAQHRSRIPRRDGGRRAESRAGGVPPPRIILDLPRRYY